MVLGKGEQMRRSILYDLPDWPGWSGFMGMFDGCRDAPYPEDSKKYGTIIFEVGCREAEAIKLKPTMFRINDEAIVGYNIPVLKKRSRATRMVVIKLDEQNPLGYDLVDYIENCDTEYLLPGRRPFSREIVPSRHISPKTVYNRITEIHPDLWPQALRGYRASMLVYERSFSVQDLVGWFNWKSADMALHYTKTRDMADAMGIKEVPR